MNGEPLLEITGVTKIFPGTKALDHVNLQVHKGEIHALCGENGAGKSTLMNIIGGIYKPTEGRLVFDGKEYAPKNPRDAQSVGIGFVHQELSLCPHLTVGENIFIGRLPKKKKRGDIIDFEKLFRDSDEVLKQFNATFNSRAVVSSLTVSECQVVEIAKSVSMKCKLLILDEPTSSLSGNETARLFDIMRKLKDQGIAILYISHRMAEIFEMCDRVTIFKDGTYVKTMNTSECNSDDIIRAMVGRNITDIYPPKSSKIYDDVLLKAEHLTGRLFKDVSFTLQKGEILGFSGLVGAGRSEIMRGLCAIDPLENGTVILNGQVQHFKEYRNAVDSGIVYLTEDRKNSGLFLGLSIKNNMISANLKSVSHGLWLDEKLEKNLSEEYIKNLNIKVAGIEYAISSLSGGNQQKCLIGKWLSTKPKVIILDEPTRGIDVGAKAEIHNLLRRLAEAGMGVIIISSELPEVMGVSDRVAVMHEGKLVDIIEDKKITEENIMKLASGETIAC